MAALAALDEELAALDLARFVPADRFAVTASGVADTDDFPVEVFTKSAP